MWVWIWWNSYNHVSVNGSLLSDWFLVTGQILAELRFSVHQLSEEDTKVKFDLQIVRWDLSCIQSPCCCFRGPTKQIEQKGGLFLFSLVLEKQTILSLLVRFMLHPWSPSLNRTWVTCFSVTSVWGRDHRPPTFILHVQAELQDILQQFAWVRASSLTNQELSTKDRIEMQRFIAFCDPHLIDVFQAWRKIADCNERTGLSAFVLMFTTQWDFLKKWTSIPCGGSSRPSDLLMFLWAYGQVGSSWKPLAALSALLLSSHYECITGTVVLAVKVWKFSYFLNRWICFADHNYFI